MIVSTAPVSVHSPYVKTLGRPAEPEAPSAPPVDTVAAPSISSAGAADRGHLGIWKTVGTVGLLAASIVTGVLGAGTANAQAAAESPLEYAPSALEYAPSGWHNTSSASCPMPQNVDLNDVTFVAKTHQGEIRVTQPTSYPLKLEDVAKMGELSIAPEHENSTAQSTRERYAELAYTVRSEAEAFARTKDTLEAEGKLLEAYSSRENGSYKVNDNCTVLVDNNKNESHTFVEMNDTRSKFVARLSAYPRAREVDTYDDGHWKSLTTTDGEQTVWEYVWEHGSTTRTLDLKGFLDRRAGDFRVNWKKRDNGQDIVARGTSIFCNTFNSGRDTKESFVVPPPGSTDPQVRLLARVDKFGSLKDSTREVEMYQDGSARERWNGEGPWTYEPPASPAQIQR